VYSTRSKLDEILRELVVRERVYPRWVSLNKLTQVQADRRIRLLREIADDYERQLKKELLL